MQKLWKSFREMNAISTGYTAIADAG